MYKYCYTFIIQAQSLLYPLTAYPAARRVSGKRFSDLSTGRKSFIFKDQDAFRNIEKYDPSDASSHHRRPLILNYSATETSKAYVEAIWSNNA